MATEEITTLDVNTTAAGDKRLTIDAAGNLVLTDQPFEHQITDAEINEDSETPSLVKGSQLLANDTFDGLSSAVAFVTAYPDKLVSIITSSEKTATECATAGIQYPDGKGADYVVVAAGTEANDSVNFINAGTKQLKLDREKGGQRLISLVDKKTSLNLAASNGAAYKKPVLISQKPVELFLKGAGTTSRIETGMRLIADPLDYFDVQHTFSSNFTEDFPSIIAQNVVAASNAREFNIYFRKSDSNFIVIIGGTQYAIPAAGDLSGTTWRFRLSGALNVLTATKDGVIVYNNTSGFSGASSEPAATTTISSRHDGSLAVYNGGISNVQNDIVIRNKPPRLLVLGASIMQGAFDPIINSVQYLHSIDSDLSDLNEYATNGNTIQNVLQILPTVLANNPAKSLFLMHGPGNNVSPNRPYKTAAIAQLDIIENGVREVIETAKAAGHDFALTNITFRNYPDLADDPENGSLPFNREIIEPLIKELTPEWWDFETGRPVLDLYQWSLDNQQYLIFDGIHYTTEGYTAMREWLLDRISENYIKINGGYSIPLHGGGVGTEEFYDFNGDAYSATLGNYSKRNWFTGVNGIDTNEYVNAGSASIGAELLLKNNTVAQITESSETNGADLIQVYWNATSVLTDSGAALPLGSVWKLNGTGALPAGMVRSFVRIS